MADEAPAVETSAAAPTGDKNKLLPVVIAAYVVAALGAAALVERVIAPGARSASAPAAPGAASVQKASHGGGHGKPEKKKSGHGGGHGSAPAVATGGNVYLIEDLVVNPAASGGLRYLAASVGLRSEQPTFLDNMKVNEAPVKDALIRIFSSKTVEELADVALRESMREEILSEVQRIIPDDGVDAIYFMRFVLQ